MSLRRQQSTLWDVECMAKHMRPIDRLECRLGNHSPYSALKAGLGDGGGLCWTVLDDATAPFVVSMFGVNKLNIWSFWSTLAWKHRTEIIKRMPAQVILCLESSGADELGNHVLSDNTDWMRTTKCFDFHEIVTVNGHNWTRFTTRPLGVLKDLAKAFADV